LRARSSRGASVMCVLHGLLQGEGKTTRHVKIKLAAG
jgi:hypothetical protein